MEIQSIHAVCDVKPFIEFEVNARGIRLQLEGEEYYCIDPICDCQLVNIEIREVGGNQLTQILYGWKSYKDYVKEGFFESDCRLMVKGGFSLPEAKTPMNKMILAGFHNWLRQDKKGKDELFAARYKEFRKIIMANGQKEFNTAVSKAEVLTEGEMIEVLKNLTQPDIAYMLKMLEVYGYDKNNGRR